MNHDEEDRFFEALAGRGEDAPDAARAKALREGIKLRADVLRETGEMAPAKSVEDTEMSARQRALFNELEAKGLFSDATDSKQTADPLLQSFFSLLRGILGSQWSKPMAYAAMLALVVGVVVQQGGVDRPVDESQIVRGSGRATVIRENPAQFVADLTARLEAAGADVAAVQISDREWNIKVSVSPGTKRQAIREQLSNAGFGMIDGEGEIDLAVTRP